MQVEEIEQLFEKHNSEYLKFERIEKVFHRRPDINAFIFLDQIVCGPAKDMVCAASHDEIVLDVNIQDLAQSPVTEEDIVHLIRSGVRLSDGCLAMFV